MPDLRSAVRCRMPALNSLLPCIGSTGSLQRSSLVSLKYRGALRLGVVLAIRDFGASDYAGIRRVVNSAWPDYAVSVQELKHDDDVITRNGFFLKRYVAVGPGDEVVAYGDMLERVERYQPGKLHVTIEVDRRFRRTGIWNRLFERLESIALKRHATALTARGCSRDRSGLSLLRRAGFRETSRDIESRLDLSRLRRRDIQAAISRSGDVQVSYTTLRMERSLNPSLLADLYEMENNAGRDVPATDRWRRMTLAEYVDLVHKSPAVIEDAWQISKVGTRYVGESFLLRGEGYPRFLGTGFTCVVREFRGRGIAEGMKLRALLWGKDHDVKIIKTWNDSTNLPILRLNRKLGFRRYALWYKLEKRLRAR